MEGVVLGLPNGSYAQRVQAEFLKARRGSGQQRGATLLLCRRLRRC
jgi:hypothetical protein